MAKYIEREAAIEAVKSLYPAIPLVKLNIDKWHEKNKAYMECETAIERIPAADVRPVVMGKWNRTDAYPHRLYCSACYKTYLKNDELLERWEFPLNFCPNCGADMREES